jgi:hypothetical protein
MKVLIFVLLASVTVQAQGIADVARKERERQTQTKTVRVFTTADAKSGATPAPSPAADSAKSPVTSKAELPAKPSADPLKEWTAQMEQIRATIRGLQDQETALQLQVNEFTNQVYAPVTTLGARSQAQADLADAQGKLVEVRKELAQTRLKLQQLESQGPPKSK